jgi:Sulfotransferase domain
MALTVAALTQVAAEFSPLIYNVSSFHRLEISMPTPLRLAMWSGPRNISTAMMRSWGNRDDTAVVDEPLYAHYLFHSKKEHPGAAEVIAAGPTDWREGVAQLTGPIPGGKSIYFQKHMTHHLLPQIDRAWLGQVTNVFLIRHPRDVITSFIKIVPRPALEDVGFVQQADIFTWVRNHTGTIPPVVDAKEVLDNPRRTLGRLCDVLGVQFQEAMLSWAPGLRPTDGVWAPHWYKEVETTTGFKPYTPKPDQVPATLDGLYRRCLECYEMMYAARLY